MLAQRTHLRTPDGKRALAAFDLSLQDWDAASPAGRLACLSVNAARAHAATLTAACALAGTEWPASWAAWTGQGHRRLRGHSGVVQTVAVGRTGDRDVIASGGDDGTVRVWDAVTGAPVGPPLKGSLKGHGRWVSSVAVGRAGDRDVIVSGSLDGTVRVWDAVTGAPVGAPIEGHGRWVYAVAIGRAGDRDIIVSGGHDGTMRVWDAVTGAPVGAPLQL